MSRVKRTSLAAALAAALPAQQGAPYAVEPIAGASAVAVGVVWYHVAAGLDAGAAAVLAETRLQHARARVRGVTGSAHVDAELSCIVAVAPAAAAADAARFVAALLDAPAAFADDTIVVATARAARLADDQVRLVPGGVLTDWAARHANGDAASSPFGDAQAMLALSPARVRELLALRVPAVGAACGAADDAFAATLPPLPGAAAAASRRAAPPSPPSPPPAASDSEVHSRVDQPFVLAAFAVQPSAALAVGIEVARGRAARRFTMRGSELRAGTPFVAWSWPAGDVAVRFVRRGENPVQLLKGEVRAADAEAERAATAAELEALLADLRTVPPREQELSNARTHVLVESGLAPPKAAAGDAAVIGGRLRNALLCRARGLTAAAVEAVGAAEAHAALAAALDPARAHWHALMPGPRADMGWRRR